MSIPANDRHEHRLAVDADWRADLRYGALGEEEPSELRGVYEGGDR